MERIITGDGSITFFNKEYSESYHTKAGALQEALVKFVQPCHLERLVREKKEILILDICFGLGYNTLTALNLLRKISDCKVKVVGIEKDMRILKKIQEVDVHIDDYELIKELVTKRDSHELSVEKGNFRLELKIGDARQIVKHLDYRFDCVFLDPFSPKKCPELWELDFMENIRKVCNESCTLTTYSCARVVRENLAKAGFTVEDVAAFGRRAPSTVAYLK